LDRYQQVLALRTNRIGVLARVADCQYALGKTNEAAAAALELAKKNNDRGTALLAQGLLDPAVGHFENAIETLTRLIAKGRRNDLEMELAVSLRNRGLVRRAQGNLGAVIADFGRAEEICARLIAREGQTDLARQHAMILTQLAWIYATSPDGSLRDGRKAREQALKACELSEWKAGAAIESLAAACAETGSFAEAVKWQEKALELAPPTQKAQLRSRLELYQSGKPYRLSLSKAN
jgi:tetratricopeptide (TPR) repeat protein